MRLFKAFFAVAFTCFTRLDAQAPLDSLADSTRFRLSTVTISATRQDEPLIRAPLAISIVTRAELANKRGYSLDEALREVPGVLAQSRYGTSDIRLVIRGFGARGAGDRSNAGTSRGIRVLLDGIPETEPDGRTSFDLVDLAAAQRIEIIRSNASALYGNAAGGVLDISTSADVDSPLYSASQMFGSFGLLRSVVSVAVPVGSGALNTTFTNTGIDGWRAHSSARRQLINSTFHTQLSPATRAKLVVSYANDLFHIPGPLSLAQAATSPRSANPTYEARDERRYNRVGRIGMLINQEINRTNSASGMFFLNPKVLQRSERGTFRDFNRYHFGGNAIFRNTHAYNAWATGRSVIGADAAHQSGTILFYSLSPTNGRGATLRDNKAEGATNTGLFAQHELQIGQRLNIEAGARYDDITYNNNNFINFRLNGSKSFTRVTPKLGVSYLLAPTHTVYLNIGGGIEAPAGNETDPAGTFGQDTVVAINPLLDAIRSTTYEVGTRNLIGLANGPFETLSFEAALYRTNVANDIVPYRGGRFYFTAGKVRRDGAELGASARTRFGLGLSGSLTISRNRYVRYTVDSVHYGRPGAFANYAGNKMPGVPNGYFGGTLTQRLSVNRPVNARVTVRQMGSYFVDDANKVSVPGHALADAGLAIADPVIVKGGLRLRGFIEVTNLFDKKHIGSAFLNPDIVGGVPLAFEPGTPRTFVVSGSLSWAR